MPETTNLEATYGPVSELSAELDGMEDFKDIELELCMERQRNDDYWKTIMKLRGGLQEIYAKRGEDDLIASICSSLIDASSPY